MKADPNHEQLDKSVCEIVPLSQVKRTSAVRRKWQHIYFDKANLNRFLIWSSIHGIKCYKTNKRYD